jgi:hypothetical protein
MEYMIRDCNCSAIVLSVVWVLREEKECEKMETNSEMKAKVLARSDSLI